MSVNELCYAVNAIMFSEVVNYCNERHVECIAIKEKRINNNKMAVHKQLYVSMPFLVFWAVTFRCTCPPRNSNVLVVSIDNDRKQ